MTYRTRINYTAAQKTEMWDRWQRGESLTAIGRVFDRPSSIILFDNDDIDSNIDNENTIKYIEAKPKQEQYDAIDELIKKNNMKLKVSIQ